MGENAELISRLEAIVGGTNLLHGKALQEIPTGFWNSAPLDALALVRPGSTLQVSEIMRLCHGLGQPVVVRGGMTGAVAGAEMSTGAVAISLERMNAIGAVDVSDSSCIVEAGAILQTVQEHAATHGLLFALDLGARGSCTIGGNIATNAGGMNVLRYGMARNQILGLEAVLADGTIVSSMDGVIKANTGYDLKQLFIGTEGTIGIVTRAVLRLHPLPTSRETALLAPLDFDSVIAVLNRLRTTLAERLTAFEVMWADYFHAQLESGRQAPPLDGEHAFYVVAESQGFDRDRDAIEFQEAMQGAFEDGLLADAVIAKSDSERSRLWHLREDLEPMLRHDPVYLYDVSVPLRHMDEYVRTVRAGLEARWPHGQCFTMGHIADGNVHFFVQPRQAGTTQEESDSEVYGPLAGFGGLISAEHGIGHDKKGWLHRNRSPEFLDTMRRLKRAFDPKGILNPGCVIA